MIVEITRLYEPDATIGMISVGGEALGFTLERQWYGNRKNVSCIPAGEYVCKKYTSPTFGEVYKVCDVFGRSNILFHKGNTLDDTSGCILMGKTVGYLDDQRAVISSAVAYRQFIHELDDVNEFKLVIK